MWVKHFVIWFFGHACVLEHLCFFFSSWWPCTSDRIWPLWVCTHLSTLTFPAFTNLHITPFSCTRVSLNSHTLWFHRGTVFIRWQAMVDVGEYDGRQWWRTGMLYWLFYKHACSAALWTSLTKCKFEDKIIQNAKMVILEKQITDPSEVLCLSIKPPLARSSW